MVSHPRERGGRDDAQYSMVSITTALPTLAGRLASWMTRAQLM